MVGSVLLDGRVVDAELGFEVLDPGTGRIVCE
jgi:hypothetical protein